MKNKSQHWTEESAKEFKLAVALDFVDQLEERLDALGLNRAQFADRLGVTEGRVSQIFNNPGNMTLGKMIEWSRALGMKLSVVGYRDSDEENKRGPINAEIFRRCWERMDKPRDAWGLEEAQTEKPSPHSILVGHAKRRKPKAKIA